MDQIATPLDLQDTYGLVDPGEMFIHALFQVRM